eukprot:scaffold6350_cov97-Skeletonema_marinoi.AAC.1
MLGARGQRSGKDKCERGSPNRGGLPKREAESQTSGFFKHVESVLADQAEKAVEEAGEQKYEEIFENYRNSDNKTRQRNNCVRTALETARFKAFGAQIELFRGASLLRWMSICALFAPQTQLFPKRSFSSVWQTSAVEREKKVQGFEAATEKQRNITKNQRRGDIFFLLRWAEA